MYRKRHEDLVHLFKMERGLVVCTDIGGLMQTLNINYSPLDWQLFIDSSKSKSNETLTLCNTVQVLFLQGHSTCFGRKRPSSGVFKASTAVTGTCVL